MADRVEADNPQETTHSAQAASVFISYASQDKAWHQAKCAHPVGAWRGVATRGAGSGTREFKATPGGCLQDRRRVNTGGSLEPGSIHLPVEDGHVGLDSKKPRAVACSVALTVGFTRYTEVVDDIPIDHRLRPGTLVWTSVSLSVHTMLYRLAQG
jgi:hypothetical protein